LTGKGLPKQLKWKEFEAFLRLLGYELFESKSGSARSYVNQHRQPKVVTFHEPHRKGKTLKLGTLREYLRKLQVTPEEFKKFLESGK
jgi:predicted RNA binding protein YcfA (HicA-like mRNA interferase family)